MLRNPNAFSVHTSPSVKDTDLEKPSMIVWSYKENLSFAVSTTNTIAKSFSHDSSYEDRDHELFTIECIRFLFDIFSVFLMAIKSGQKIKCHLLAAGETFEKKLCPTLLSKKSFLEYSREYCKY